MSTPGGGAEDSVPAKRGRGRPKGSKNGPSAGAVGRPRKDGRPPGNAQNKSKKQQAPAKSRNSNQQQATIQANDTQTRAGTSSNTLDTSNDASEVGEGSSALEAELGTLNSTGLSTTTPDIDDRVQAESAERPPQAFSCGMFAILCCHLINTNYGNVVESGSGSNWSPPHGRGLGNATKGQQTPAFVDEDEDDENVDYVVGGDLAEDEERGEFQSVPDDDDSRSGNVVDADTSRQKRASLPSWLLQNYADMRERLVSEIAKNVSQRPTCYDRGTFFDDASRAAVKGGTQYLSAKGWPEYPRRVVDLEECIFIVGYRYVCPNTECRKTFLSWSPALISALPRSLAVHFTHHLTHRSGLSDRVVSLMRSCFQRGVGPGPFAEMIQTQHIRHYEQLHLQYLETILIRSQSSSGHLLAKFPPFGLFDDVDGYAGFVPSPAYFRQFYVNYIASHASELDQHMAMLSATLIQVDHSFKVIRHLGKVSGETVFAGGLHTSVNEFVEIRSMVLTPSKAHSQFMPALCGISKSLEMYGHKPIGAVMTDMPRIDKPELEKMLPSLLTDVVPVPDITVFPQLTVPEDWNVTQLGSRYQVNTRLNTIMNSLVDNREFVVAMDMEWPVDTQNGIQGSVALISIAFNHEIFLIPLHQYWQNEGLPNTLLAFLRSPQILKVGVKINADFKRLSKDCKFTEKDQAFAGAIELGHLAKEKNLTAHAGIGLADLTSLILRRFLPKDPSIRVSTAWDNSELSETQKSYAALDVFATWEVFHGLSATSASGSVVTRDTPGGTAVSLLSSDRSRIVANGFVTPDQPKTLNGVNVTKTRLVVTVTSVVVPAHLVSRDLIQANQATPLSSFPSPPFTLVCKLKHLSISHTDTSHPTAPRPHAQSSPGPHPDIVIYSSDHANESTTSNDGPNSEAERWYNKADLVDDDDEDPAAAVADESAATYAVLLGAIAQSLDTRTSNSGLKRSGVFGDIWHLMHQFSISMQHGLRRPFARALRDAFFLYDEEDKAEIEAFLATKGVKWDYMLQYHPHWLFQRVKRYVPPPEDLLPRVTQVIQAFGPLKDAKTGTPLFNEKCWDIAKNALENIRRGYYSDPPGVTLYYPRKRDKFGLQRYRCCRGTPGIEGGVHQNIIRWFGSFNASPDFALELLRDYALYHNLKVGTYNRTGVPYMGSFDIWTRNQISQLLDSLSTRFSSNVPNFGPGGWVNGNNFARSTEVFGILPISGDFCTRLGMLVYHPEFAREFKIRHQYLALRQNTRVAILPIHTPDERGLFKLLLANPDGPFSGRTEPNWMDVAAQWNNHANGLTIFYKLPEHLKSYWKKWQENANEKNSISINRATFDNIVRSLSLPQSSIPHVMSGQPQSVRDQIDPSTEIPTTIVEPWKITQYLGRHSLQQSTVHFHYGERPPPPSRLDKGKKRAAAENVDEDNHGPIIKISTRKARTCPKCHRAGCDGAFRSRPCST
ncbi:hypothetical protein H0H93_016335 [Arthromyces matolae]|nr:hypothetical protein H0H93_016335 [Arthromyces matolae]